MCVCTDNIVCSKRVWGIQTCKLKKLYSHNNLQLSKFKGPKVQFPFLNFNATMELNFQTGHCTQILRLSLETFIVVNYLTTTTIYLKICYVNPLPGPIKIYWLTQDFRALFHTNAHEATHTGLFLKIMIIMQASASI